MRDAVVTAILAMLAATAAGLLVLEMVATGMPSFATVIVTAMIMGVAAAWPVARRQEEMMEQPTCGDCGYAHWASADMGFCIHCGSSRVWQMDG